MGCYPYCSKNNENQELLIERSKELIGQSKELIEQNKKLIQQNTEIKSTSVDLTESLNKLGEKISSLFPKDHDEDKKENDKVNIIFQLGGGRKKNVAIEKNKTILEAFKKFQEREINCKDIDKVKITYSAEDITEKIKHGEIVSNLGNNSKFELKVSNME